MAQPTQPTTQKASMTAMSRPNTAQARPRAGVPKGGQFVMQPYRVSVAVNGMGYGGGMPMRAPMSAPMAVRQPQQAQPEPTKQKKGKKRNRREREYFFVMRKGVCFFMFLVSMVMIAVLALSFLKIMPQYTAMFVSPDLTPGEERPEDEWDEEGELIPGYEDQSGFVGVSDGIYGLLGRLTGGSAEEELEAEAADDEAVDGEEGTVDGDVTEGDEAIEEEGPRSPFYDDISAKLDALTGEDAPEIAASDSMLQIASYLFIYGPIAYVVMAVILILTAIKAFFGMFGRRIFKRFGLAAIILLVCAIVILLTGLIGAGVLNGNPSEDEDGVITSVLDFGGAVDFITQAFQTYPATADELAEGTFLTFKAGYGCVILLVAPIALLVLSFFARRKVPYSIFDR